MLRHVRSAIRRLLGVRRDPTYYLHIEARFTSGRDARDLDATVTQIDADGGIAGVQRTTLTDSTDAREGKLTPVAPGYGLVTVAPPALRSDFYVALRSVTSRASRPPTPRW